MRQEKEKEVIYKILELKLIELKKQIKNITILDLYQYFNEVILKNNRIKDINDVSFYLMNIKVNKVYEYLNFKNIINNNSTIEADLKSILEG